MTSDFVISYGRQALLITIQIAGPVLAAALIIGLVVSIFQAVTQIQEMTLAIIPKMIAVIAMLFIFYPWFLSLLQSYFIEVFSNIPQYIGI